MSTADLSEMSDTELMKLEREIAAQHIDKFPYLIIFWTFANLGCWLALWPLVLMGYLPVWLAFPIATLNIMLSYLPSHEAQHDIIAKPGSKLRWLNQLVGHVSTLPLVLPYRVAKWTHMEHHKHTNDPKLDPDYSVHAPSARAAIWKSLLNRQPRGDSKSIDYRAALERTGKGAAMLDAVVYDIVFYGVLIGLAWNGFAIEAALIWWLPRHIAISYIDFYLSWAPHHPGTSKGRYRDTNSFRSIFGNIGSMGMQYHVIHHLHPRIPLYRTPKAYWQMRDILEARGSDVSKL